MARFAAVDLGASSGRVLVVDVDRGTPVVEEVHRFANRPVRVRGTLHWDVLALWAGVLDGLRRAGPGLRGVGVDSWAIDYALLDEDGELLGNPVHYRDGRTDGIAERVAFGGLYSVTGVQILPFNTVFQLVAARGTAALRQAARALLIPDLFGYWLTGEMGTELTNASTTGLLDVRRREWSAEVHDRLDLPRLFPPIRQPGTLLGRVLPAVGVGETEVFTVGSHDTASAVVGVPASGERFAYVSCGTWSLVGVELAEPVTTPAARAANFSNELGVDGTVRFLRNVMGLWLLQESLRTWEQQGMAVGLAELLAEAERLPTVSIVDPDRPEFLPPGDMPSRIRAECHRTGQPVPETPAELTRCVLDSLADAYRRTVAAAAAISGRAVDVVHIVGGGSRNALLCQLTADACGLPVIAGPTEAAALGNALIQARTAGVVQGGLAELRARLHDLETRTYQPGGDCRTRLRQ